MNKVVIVSACRSPQAKVPGYLSALKDFELMSQCFRSVIDKIQLDAKKIQYAFVGSCLPVYRQNLGRKAVLEAGISETVSATTVNKRCASGMEALFQGIYRIMSGAADTVLIGGVESTSNSGYALGYLKENVIKRTTDKDMFRYDSFIHKYNEDDIAVIAEKLAREYNISKDEINSHTLAICQNALLAQERGYFGAEIVPIVDVINNKIINKDDLSGLPLNIDTLENAVPFSINDGYFNQYHSARLGDGAAALILMSEEKAEKEGYPIMCRVIDQSCIGVSFQEVGTAIIKVVEKLIKVCHMNISDIDLFEMNEAFSVQSLLYQRILQIPNEKVNISGSEIAFGYAMGCTSLRSCVSLIYNLKRSNLDTGIAATTAGGCMAQAILLRNR
jgi:acetyl-CoA acetyltransferase family protein